MRDRSYQYTDDDINNYINAIISNQLGGYANEGGKRYRYLLQRMENEKSPTNGEKPSKCFIAVTPAVDCNSIPFGYFFNKSSQPKNPMAVFSERIKKRQSRDASLQVDVLDELLPKLFGDKNSSAKYCFLIMLTRTGY